MQFNATLEKSQAQAAAFNSKAVEFAENNTKAAFAFAREALAAKTPETLWSVQQSFVKTQQEAVKTQFEAFNAFYADWMRETSAPMADAMKPFMAAFTKAA
jgi:hypothetical protein